MTGVQTFAFPVSYHEAIRALKYEKGKVAHVEDIEVVNEIMDHYPIEKEKELLESIKKSNLNKTRDLATELFQWLQNCYGDKEEGIKFKVLEIILVAEKMAIDNGKMIQDTMERSKYLEIVANVPTQDYLLKWFLEKLEEVSRNMAIVDTDRKSVV